MSLMTGWCMDERQAREDLDDYRRAEVYHSRCKADNCPCPGHQEV